MSRVFFGLARETGTGAGRVNKDPVGFFSCVHWVAKFLEIQDKGFNGTIYGKKREYKDKRANTRVDGATLKFSNDNSDNKNAGTEIALQRTIGPKRVIIKTWKAIKNSGEEGASGAQTSNTPVGSLPRHEISFAFPAWATVRVISDALGEIIPEKKISSLETASTDKILPYWKYEKGGTYGITPKTVADADESSTTQKEKVKRKVKAKGGDVVG